MAELVNISKHNMVKKVSEIIWILLQTYDLHVSISVQAFKEESSAKKIESVEIVSKVKVDSLCVSQTVTWLWCMMYCTRVQGIMGSVSSLIPGAKNCRGSDHKLKKGFQCKRGGRLKHGFSQEHNAKNNNNSKLSHGSAGTGNSDDFFYIKVSHKPRGDETPNDTGSRKTPTELSMCTRLEQVSEFLLNIKKENWDLSVAIP